MQYLSIFQFLPERHKVHSRLQPSNLRRRVIAWLVTMDRYKKTPAAIARLTPEQYRVTQKSDTERSFHNEFCNSNDPGLYVDIASSEPLFTSLDKFDSDCGWPSFMKPVTKGDTVDLRDDSHGMLRTEVRSKNRGSHLGHVFPECPRESGGPRYCIYFAA